MICLVFSNWLLGIMNLWVLGAFGKQWPLIVACHWVIIVDILLPSVPPWDDPRLPLICLDVPVAMLRQEEECFPPLIGPLICRPDRWPASSSSIQLVEYWHHVALDHATPCTQTLAMSEMLKPYTFRKYFNTRFKQIVWRSMLNNLYRYQLQKNIKHKYFNVVYKKNIQCGL